MASASLVKQRRALAKLWLKWRLAIIATLVLVLLISVSGYAWREFAARSDDQMQQATEAATSAIATGVGAVMDAESGAMAVLLASVDLPAVLASDDALAVAAAETRMSASRPEVLRVRILPLGDYRADYETSPPLSYASIDLLRRSAESAGGVAPEVHLFGTPEEHIALASPVRDASGTLIGHALIAVNLSVLRETMAAIVLGSGYAELQQLVGGAQRLALAAQGDAAMRQGAPALSIPVPTTDWRVAYWVDAPAAANRRQRSLPPWAVGAVLVLIAGIGLSVVRRRKAGAASDTSTQRRGAASSVDALSQKLAALQGRSDEAPAAEAEQEPGMLVVEELDELPASGDGEPERGPDGAVPAGAAPDLDPSIFRAYDVRGVVGKGLDAEVVREIGRAVGSEAQARGQQTMVVACDGRDSGPELLEALVDGLLSTGRDVVDVGRVPTPVLYFATHYLNTGSGVMVTGSHNPPEYNGLKIMIDGDTLFGDDVQALRRRIESGDMVSGQGKRQSMEIVDEYIRRVTEDVPVALGNSFKVVVDCGNGIAGVVAPKLIRALGHDVVELYCDVDGSFPNHHPDPSQPDNLADLIRTVAERDADIGFAFDGDGDRLGVVDRKGNIIWPDRQLMLFAHDVLKRPEYAGAEIVYDVKCTNLLAKVIAKSGGKPVMVQTGHSFLKNELKQRNSPLAGELSGHIFFKDRWYGFDDALYAAARMLEIILATKRKPTEVLKKLPSGVSTPELRIDMEEGEQIEFMERLMSEPRFEDGKATTIDGLRIDFDDGWGLVRASNTTPSIVLRFEGSTQEALERIEDRFREVLLAVDPELTLPY